MPDLPRVTHPARASRCAPPHPRQRAFLGQQQVDEHMLQSYVSYVSDVCCICFVYLDVANRGEAQLWAVGAQAPPKIPEILSE
jgi:hypothetical protein